MHFIFPRCYMHSDHFTQKKFHGKHCRSSNKFIGCNESMAPTQSTFLFPTFCHQGHLVSHLSHSTSMLARSLFVKRACILEGACCLRSCFLCLSFGFYSIELGDLKGPGQVSLFLRFFSLGSPSAASALLFSPPISD